ncbi:Hsp20/alpha crystallin family protein (plasmid) [Cupriavidus pauculus]|uniref:Hsp20/alpha crystallin family protein n=1 Tax=Cupriavidus pauculus TaxID=82633 RepID=A0A5P2H9X1_9BURK|nr:Hsp20/alpha crystallin family protein [Cupriavidus pauculus]
MGDTIVGYAAAHRARRAFFTRRPHVRAPPPSCRGAGGRVTLVPAVDIVEDTNGVTLWADLPGVSRENLQVSSNEGALHIEGQAVVPTPSGLRVQHAEIRQPHFARSFSLRPDRRPGTET